MCFYSQSVIIYFLVYFEYIKNIFDDSIPYDYNILSTELQVSCLFSIPIKTKQKNTKEMLNQNKIKQMKIF